MNIDRAFFPHQQLCSSTWFLFTSRMASLSQINKNKRLLLTQSQTNLTYFEKLYLVVVCNQTGMIDGHAGQAPVVGPMPPGLPELLASIAPSSGKTKAQTWRKYWGTFASTNECFHLFNYKLKEQFELFLFSKRRMFASLVMHFQLLACKVHTHFRHAGLVDL